MDKRKLVFFLAALLLTEYTQISFADSPTSAQEEIKKLNKQLSELIDHYNAEHDDLLATKQRLEAIEDKLSAGSQASQQSENTAKPAESTANNSSNNVDSANNNTTNTTTPATTSTEPNNSSTTPTTTAAAPVAEPPPTTSAVMNPYKNVDPPPSDDTSAKADPPASTNTSASNDPPAGTNTSASNDPPASTNTSASNDPPANTNTSASNDPPANTNTSPNNAQPAGSNTSANTDPSNGNQNSDSGDEVQKSPGPQRGIDAYLQQQNIALTRRFTIEADISFTGYDRNDLTLNGFLALDSIFLGDISIDQVNANTTEVDFIARYALTDRMQISATLPVIYRRTQFTKTGVQGSSTLTDTVSIAGAPRFGDLQAALYMLAYKETPKFPGVIWNLILTVPTGLKPYGIKTIDVSPDQFTVFVIPSVMPTGLGVYSLSSGVSLTRTVDPAVIFANLSLQYNFVRSFTDISSLPGQKVPGSVKLGDSFTYGLGIAYALNERTSVSLSYSQQVTANDSSKTNSGQWVTQKGSSTEPATLNTAFTYSFSNNFAMVANLQTGLNTDAPDFVAQLKFPYTFG